MGSINAELLRLAPTKDWVADSRKPEEPSDEEEVGEQINNTRAGKLIADSSYSIPSINWMRRHFGPPVPMRSEGGEGDEARLREAIATVLPLLREIFKYVTLYKTGHIDWQAVAQAYNLQGEVLSPISAVEAKRLWRAVAYVRVEMGEDDVAETPELQAEVRKLLDTRLARALPARARKAADATSTDAPASVAVAAEDDAESDFEGYIYNQRERESNVEQTQPSGVKSSTSGTLRLYGRPWPPAIGFVAPQPPTDGSGPFDLGLDPPKKGKGANKKEEEEMSLQEAMRLTVLSKPWTEEDDKKLVALVAKHGLKEQTALEKGMRRTWGSISSRIRVLQNKGQIPKQDPSAATAAPVAAGRAKPPQSKSSSGGVKRDRNFAVGAEKQAPTVDPLAVKAAPKRKLDDVNVKSGAGLSKPEKSLKKAKPKSLLRTDRAPTLSKRAAKDLVGRSIEIYWDGMDTFYEAEVLSYDEEKREHFVRYVDDGVEEVETLHTTPWKGPLPKPTARTAKRPRTE